MTDMTRRDALRAALAAAATLAAGACASTSRSLRDATTTTATPARPGGAVSVVVYRSPTCGCCQSWEEHLRGAGFAVESRVVDDVAPVKADHHVPPDAQSCHTAIIGDYAVEGHVPVEAIDKLLAEQPPIDGIAVPGMPTNAPGMGEPDGRPLPVLSFHQGRTAPFVTL